MKNFKEFYKESADDYVTHKAMMDEKNPRTGEYYSHEVYTKAKGRREMPVAWVKRLGNSVKVYNLKHEYLGTVDRLELAGSLIK